MTLGSMSNGGEKQIAPEGAMDVKQQPTVVVISDVRRPDVRQRKPASRKCVIISATIAVIVALLVIGALVAIKLVTDSNLERLKYERQFRNGETFVNETYFKDDTSSWVTEYHVTEGKIDSWTMDDFKRGVRIFKLRPSGGDWRCFVTLHESANTSLDSAAAADSNTTGVVNRVAPKTEVRYRVSENPVNDVFSFVSTTANDFCKNLDVYLAYQADSQPDNQGATTRRRKRYMYCQTDWLSCKYFSYPDHPEVQYFGCATKCSQ